MFWRLALALAGAQLRVAERRKAAIGTYRWVLWLLAWAPLYVLTAWLFDLACLKYRKEPVCQSSSGGSGPSGPRPA